MDGEQIFTNFQQLDSQNYRVYITKNNITYSIVVPCNGHPSPEAIIDFFNKNHKKFDIEI